MKVNEQKTDLCLFYIRDTAPVSIVLSGQVINSNKTINVLGVLFDSKLQWSDHIALTIKKSFFALNAIKLIYKFFTPKELLQLITSNFYSILFYNSEIWHLPTLKPPLKQKLLSASANALKVCRKFVNNNVSYESLHKSLKRANPEKFMKYKLDLCLYKLYNTCYSPAEFVRLNFNQILTFNTE